MNFKTRRNLEALAIIGSLCISNSTSSKNLLEHILLGVGILSLSFLLIFLVNEICARLPEPPPKK